MTIVNWNGERGMGNEEWGMGNGANLIEENPFITGPHPRPPMPHPFFGAFAAIDFEKCAPPYEDPPLTALPSFLNCARVSAGSSAYALHSGEQYSPSRFLQSSH